MQQIETDVLIIGAGAAGIRAALAASTAGVEVFTVAKGNLVQSGSTFSPIAQGWGIQALVGKERTERNLEIFYEDIVRVGLGICDPNLVRILVEESGERLEDLISYGMQFKRDRRGNFIRANGCFSDVKRAFLTKDMENIKTSFLSMLRHAHAKIFHGYVLKLAIADGSCWGAWLLTPPGRILAIKAKATVLATGGGGGIYHDRLVSNEEIGDGYALAQLAGAELTNLEFIQFMLGIKNENVRRFLPLKALFEPFALRHENGDDLIEKDIPSIRKRANAISERQAHFPFSCRDTSCLLDIAVATSHRKKKRVLWEYSDFTMQKNLYEVVHFAHAFNGGVTIGVKGETGVPGLFAAGEVAAGPHGADRIGGCMMAATQVFGKRAGEAAAQYAKDIKKEPFPDMAITQDISWIKDQPDDVKPDDSREMASKVRAISNDYLGVLRWHDGLKACQRKLDDCADGLQALKGDHAISPHRYFQIRNMILVGKTIARACLMRKESLGAHFREDFPPCHLSTG